MRSLVKVIDHGVAVEDRRPTRKRTRSPELGRISPEIERAEHEKRSAEYLKAERRVRDRRRKEKKTAELIKKLRQTLEITKNALDLANKHVEELQTELELRKKASRINDWASKRVACRVKVLTAERDLALAQCEEAKNECQLVKEERERGIQSPLALKPNMTASAFRLIGATPSQIGSSFGSTEEEEKK